MEFPDKNAASQRVIANAQILRKLGFNLILVGVDKSNKPHDIYNVAKGSTVNGFHFYSRRYPKTIFQWFHYISNIRWLIELIKRHDEKDTYAVIAYNFPAVALIKLLGYTRKNNIKLIADCTEWYGKSKNIVKLVDTLLRMRFVHKRIRNIICVSDYLQDYYKKAGCITANLPSLLPDNKKWKNNSQYTPGKIKIFLYVGSPGTSKEKDRLDFVIKAFSQLKKKGYQFQFQIVGVTKEKFFEIYPDCKEIVNLLSGELFFMGRLSHLDSISIIKKSDFTIFARKKNKVTMAGFPTKLGESYCCGVPVITNPTSNISRYLINGKNGYIAKDCTIDGLVKAVEIALNESDCNLIEMHKYCKENNPLKHINFLGELEAFFHKIN